MLEAQGDAGGFTVRLENFTGPFDLLLQLIGKHKLDVTEVALHQVTDDFIAYIRAMGDEWDLDEASEFLLVAATLLDLKAARLLPAAEVEDEEDLALLEARDLLFARLLQYKAYKEAAAFIADLEGTGARRWPRAVSMEPRYAEALPDLVLGIGAERLFKLALKQFTPKPGPPEVSIAHIHQVRVSVREHATLLRDRLRRAGSATFSLLIADCDNTLEVVARFLALLELYREGLIDFEQPVSLDELTVRWIGGADAEVADLDIDDYEGSPPDPEAPPAEPVTDADLANVGLADPADTNPPDTNPPDADLADADQAGADVPGVDLADADLAGADVPGVDLAGAAGLAGADVPGVDLADADQADADLTDADLADAELANAGLADVELADAGLADAGLADADQVGVAPADAGPAVVDLTGAGLGDAESADAGPAVVDLADTELAGVELGDADRTGVGLVDVEPFGADLAGVELGDADRTGVGLVDAEPVDGGPADGTLSGPGEPEAGELDDTRKDEDDAVSADAAVLEEQP